MFGRVSLVYGANGSQSARIASVSKRLSFATSHLGSLIAFFVGGESGRTLHLLSTSPDLRHVPSSPFRAVIVVDYNVHVYMRQDGLAGTVTADLEYPPRVAFVLLTQVSRIKAVYSIALPKTESGIRPLD